MPRIYTPSAGPDDWRRLLAEPDKHWKAGRSALELAVSWESTRNTVCGLPTEIAACLDTEVSLRDSDLLVCFPEHQVHLEGGGHPSQNDLWALLRTATGTASLALEAKAGESLDKLVKDWLPVGNQRSGKPVRLAALQALLSIRDRDVSAIRYQLLHRAASALLEARRFHAESAILIVQSFNRTADGESWLDFLRFGKLLGIAPVEGSLHRVPLQTEVPFYIGWVASTPTVSDIHGAAGLPYSELPRQ